MPMTVDELQIELNAKAVKANDVLDKLDNKLASLQKTLGGLDTSKLADLGNAVRQLSQGMNALKVDKIGKADFTRLANGLTAIASVNGQTIERAANAMNKLNGELANLKNINVSATSKQVADLAKGISQLGYKSATQAIDNIPKLAQGMSQMMHELSKAPKVSQNLIDMTNALAKLARTGTSGGRAANALGKSLDKYTASTHKARKGTFSLAGALGKLYASYWLIFRAFRKLGESINLASSLTEVENVVNTTFGKYAELVDKMADTAIADFGMSELTTKKVASRFQAMGTAMGFSQGKMADMSIELTKLTADMASFYNVEQDVVAQDLASIFTGETRPLRDYGLDLTQATLAEWAMKQGLDANIQSMSQAEKALLRYRYVLANTGAAQGDFARTAHTWANQIRILKQNFEALGIVVGKTLINALRPLITALNNAMGHIIAFAETVSNALGKIFGWKYEKTIGGGMVDEMAGAADYSDDLAGGMGEAADKAKKLKTHLLGIDELNVVRPDDDDGTGAGAGGGLGNLGGAGGAGGGQWTKTETIWEDYKSEIDSLYELGEYIGETLTNMLNSIDWKKVYESARNFGKGLADFLNGLISPELFGAVGRTIAGALNTAIYAALTFGETFDWKDLGLSIATGINEFFKTFDFGALANTVDAWAQGIWTTIKTAIANLEWSAIWDGIKELWNEIDFETLAISIGAFTFKYGHNILTKAKIGKALVAALGGTASTITLTGITVVAALAIKYAKENEEELQKQFEGYSFQVNVDWGKVWENFKTGLDTTIDRGYQNYVPPSESIPVLLTEEEVQAQQQHVENVRSTWESLGTTLKNVWDDAKEAFNGFINHVGGDGSTSSIGLGMPDLLAGIQQKWAEVQQWWDSTIAAWWENNIVPWFTAEKWYEVANGIQEGISAKWAEIVAWWQETAIYTWWENDVKPWFTAEKWKTELENIKTAFKDKWGETAKQWREKLLQWWETDVKPWFTLNRWMTLLKSVADSFRDRFQEAREWVEEKVQAMFDFVNPILAKIRDAIAAIKDAISGVIDAAKGIGGAITGNLGVSINLPGYISGGFPERSSLFFAGEHGIPEILGTVGGRTAVAGGDEITGIRQAVYDTGNAETALMETMISLLQVIAEKETSFEVDGRELLSAVNDRQNRSGFSFA